jgi:hypothetical protein
VGRRRRLVAGAGVLAAVAVVAVLRAGTEPVVPAVPEPTPPVTVPPLPTGPFDRLPGRTPIPRPSERGGTAQGALPPTGPGPSEEAAVRATQLVLGRYCARPDRYTISVVPQDGWRLLGGLATGLDRGGDGPLIDLLLAWDGRSYRWSGSLVQLRGC